MDEASIHHLPKVGWMKTLTKILRYKAKKGDIITVEDSTQLGHVTEAVANQAVELDLTIITRQSPPEDESLILH